MVMNKGGRKRLGQLAAVLSLAVASPALADNEPKPSEFEQTIAQAKSLMMADSAAALALLNGGNASGVPLGGTAPAVAVPEAEPPSLVATSTAEEEPAEEKERLALALARLRRCTQSGGVVLRST